MEVQKIFGEAEQERFERYVRHAMRQGYDKDDAISLGAQRVIKDRTYAPPAAGDEA